MTNKKLSKYINIQRRYSRSINLERDLESYEALNGYILTQRAIDSLTRIIKGFNDEEGNKAWTLTSVYGTGKSAFAHFLVSLCAKSKNKLDSLAKNIIIDKLGTDSEQYQLIEKVIPSQGLIRAVATAQREPISHTIIRALLTGVENFWDTKKRNKIEIVRKLVDLATEINSGGTVSKNLEYASTHRGAEDLYILQQLAEAPKNSKTPIYILGILHQAFAEYGQRLASIQRNEWAKIQGRFEDIAFTESVGQMINLIGSAINRSEELPHTSTIKNQAQIWFKNLKSTIVGEEVTSTLIENIYPLHPLTALVLPTLCQKYAQNDRSLFTFLTSKEPFSFSNFLDEVTVQDHHFPRLKLDRVYDYFIESVGMGLASRPNLQRWVEIQDLIKDAKHLEEDELRVLKTIGILNLITVTGSLRATKKLVSLAMCDDSNNDEINHWQEIIENLLKRNLITHRRQLDELRIWEGSDFHVDSELEKIEIKIQH